MGAESNKIAILMTGWQAIQFSVANQDKMCQFDIVLVTGAWSRSILDGFKIVELAGFDKYGRLPPRKMFSAISQLWEIVKAIPDDLELWRPDIGGHVVEYLSRSKKIKKIVFIEDGIGSIAVKQPVMLRIRNRLRLLVFLSLAGSIFRKKTNDVINLVLDDVSHKIPENGDVIIAKDEYLLASRAISKKKYPSAKLLVLTQPISEMGYMTISQEIKMQQDLLAIAHKNRGEINAIAIKPHPGEADEFLGVRRDALKNNRDIDVITIDKEVPAELYYISLDCPPEVIVSYCSSALLNIKKAFRGSHCIAFIAKDLRRFVPDEVIESFVEMGVDVHEG